MPLDEQENGDSAEPPFVVPGRRAQEARAWPQLALGMVSMSPTEPGMATVLELLDELGQGRAHRG